MDVGVGWMDEYGLIMEEIVKWTQLAFSDVPAIDRIESLEEVIREFQHMGSPAAHLDASVIPEFFSDLPEQLRETLFEYMSVGVDTGLDRRTKKTTSPPSKTAVENSDAVWKHLRTFAQNSFIRAFPPTVRHIIEPAWGCDLSQSHYVLGTKWKKGDRFVANLSRPSNESLAEGEVNGDVNARSPDLGYDEVQADYIDNVVRDFVLFLKTDGKFTTTKMIQIEADIKAAFKCVVLSLKSMGTLCVEMDDWIMVYIRTAFGWKCK